MKIKLTDDMVMDVIRQAKVENMAGSFCVPQVDPRIREIVANVDARNTRERQGEPTEEELREIIALMGFKPEERGQ